MRPLEFDDTRMIAKSLEYSSFSMKGTQNSFEVRVLQDGGFVDEADVVATTGGENMLYSFGEIGHDIDIPARGSVTRNCSKSEVFRERIMCPRITLSGRYTRTKAGRSGIQTR